jgi:hypothetical protein
MQLSETAKVFSGEFLLDVQDESPITIKGLRVNADTSLNWPWNQDIILRYLPVNTEDEDREIIIQFSTMEIEPTGRFAYDILNDDGSTVLLKIIE